MSGFLKMATYCYCHAMLLLLLAVGSSSYYGAHGAQANAAGFTNGMRYVDVLNQNNIHDPHDSPSFSSWKTSGSQIVHVESGMPRDNDKEDDENEDDDDEDEEDTIDDNDSDDNHKKHKHKKHTKSKEYEDVSEHFLVQRLDHFAPSENQTFTQRYFYSDRFVSGTTPKKYQYVFLCCGGEGPALDASVLVDSIHCTGDMVELAAILHKELDANVYMFGLEHRYYGKSYPKFVDEDGRSESPVTNENLIYLSSRQALADLAHFITYITTQPPHKQTTTKRHVRGGEGGRGCSSDTEVTRAVSAIHQGLVPADTKWVTFGGSYPGMIAGWARLKYPHLVHAAVSNSAPVQAKADMASYYDRVAFDLQYQLIGGSDTCLEIFQKGHAELVDAIESGEESIIHDIADQFDLCHASDLKNRKNAQLFLGDGVFHVPAQENDPSCQKPMCNIEKLCSFADEKKGENSTKANWEVLAEMAQERKLHKHYRGCVDIDYRKMLDYFASPTESFPGGTRSWIWQTCTEFGFYQTCEQSSKCPFAKGYHPLEEDLEICRYAYGITSEEVRESIRQTMEYYGDRELKGGSRILSVNGNVDPWATLARTNQTTNPWLPTYVVEGASHHFWTHQVKASDGEKMKDARQFIYDTVTKWLQMEGDKLGDVSSAETELCL